MPRVELDPSLIGGGNVFGAYQNALANGFKSQAAQLELEQERYKMNALNEDRNQQNALAKLLSTQGFDASTAQGQGQMYGAGGVKGTQGYLKGQADIGKVTAETGNVTAETAKRQADARKIELENHLQKFEVIERLMRPVRDQASFDQMKQFASQSPLIADMVQSMPAQYDPQLIADNMAKAMPLKDKLAAEHSQLTLAETKRSHIADEGISVDNNIRTNDTSRLNNRDTNATSRANNSASVGATMRGQNMTDARSRELNDTRIEDNRIKREAKDDTNNLTKQGQLASFDTMLGTLDRLGKHPGLSRSVGMTGMLPTIPGSDSANFQAELNTFQSQAFLPMVAQLKGMGALSDAEGKKLTAAVGALDPKMGEKAFRESVQRITDDMSAAKGRMLTNGKSAMPQANQDSAAVAWAKANPNDPRAAKIMQLQGR